MSSGKDYQPSLSDSFWSGPIGQTLANIQKVTNPIWDSYGKIFPHAPLYKEIQAARTGIPAQYSPQEIIQLGMGMMGNMENVGGGIPVRQFTTTPNYLSKPNLYKIEDQFGGTSMVKIKDGEASIIDLHNRSAGGPTENMGIRQTPQGYIGNLLKDIISHLKNQHGVKDIKIMLQSQDTTAVLKKLLDQGILHSPRENFGSSTSLYPTKFSIK